MILRVDFISYISTILGIDYHGSTVPASLSDKECTQTTSPSKYVCNNPR
jgi:hypothetical protein